ncbi:polysaccharide deacetylase family sporulation protein PdaB [Halobacillus shinanisalinarum]|uniref:Polysaccharide deacetylase family sporulation protein PdaB n=1 Tax=Halobacillus shinanisalinarum TaxID=2932258 RepID=A0ABY4GTU4_9BACI|nr:polysaccharide deacetylase family sporulation protein PdaB [Halobacillus shinanisalinarum]UOQ91558.1 polysaccharide deacetylase family sporulation protein PdaB [Halobacillus shinanisalinarum]
MSFYTWRMEKIKRYGVIIFLALFCAVLMWIGQMGQLPVFSNDGEPKALSQGSEEQPYIALTFNISWGNEKVNGILEKLKAHQAKATFFLSGSWAERHQDIVEAIHEDKHEIAITGYEYESYTEMEPEEIRRDIQKAKEVFEKLGFEDINYIRPPHGHLNEEILAAIEQEGLETVQWSLNPRDWENPGTNAIIDQIMGTGAKGDIILLHASDSVKQTAKALEVVIPGLKQKGFEFVTITELVNGGKAKITQE